MTITNTFFLFFQNQAFVFIAFLVFEVCVGIFWPSMSTMRGKYVPEESKSKSKKIDFIGSLGETKSSTLDS